MIVLVTGCSSGFGLRIATRAADSGHTVYAGLRDIDEPGELAERLEGRRITPIQLDITDAEQRAAAVSRILAEQGRIDALVNNAGVVLGGYMEDIAEDELREIFEVNFFGSWELTRLCLPSIRSSKGIVINLSSISGLRAFPGLGAYSASKFALEGLSESLRQELEPHGARVVLIEPGAFNTPIWGRNCVLSRGSGEEESPYTETASQIEATIRANANHDPGNPDDIANLVVRLFEEEDPEFRHILWGNRRSKVLFTRAHRRWAYRLPEDG
jgi:NAD(P)-dependent dehydrogenase (short-subunit alcohol dehydrogenase family)